MQPAGARIRSGNERWDPETGALSMDIFAAYPGAGLVNFVRTAVIKDGHVIVTDSPEFKETGFVEYNYMCVNEPVVLSPGSISAGNAVMEYDPSLNVRIKAVDSASEPETANIPSNWHVDNIYRIVLKTPEFSGARTDIVRIG